MKVKIFFLVLSFLFYPLVSFSADFTTASSGDDVGRDGNESWSTTAITQSWGLYGGNNGRVVLRFPNVAIPSGVTVTEAILQGEAWDADDDGVDMRVYGLEGDTEQSEIDTEAEVDGLTRTSNYEDFVLNSSTWSSNTVYTLIADSADFRAVIQEILDTGWSSGYDLALDIVGNEPADWTVTAGLENYDFDFAVYTLTINYTEPSDVGQVIIIQSE